MDRKPEALLDQHMVGGQLTYGRHLDRIRRLLKDVWSRRMRCMFSAVDGGSLQIGAARQLRRLASCVAHRCSSPSLVFESVKAAQTTY